MIYKFIDDKGTFRIKNPQRYNLYFPLSDSQGTLLSSIAPNLSGDIKRDNNHFLSLPASIEDLRGNLMCRREFFIKTSSRMLRLSYPYEDTVEVGFLYQKVIKDIQPGLKIEILNFIPHNLAVEIMWVRVINTAGKAIKISPTSFMPLFGRAENNLRDHRHVSSLLNRIELDKYGIYLRPTMIFDEAGHKIGLVNYFVLGFEENFRPAIGQFPTLDYFYGRSDIAHPEALEGRIKPLRQKLPGMDGKEACAAFRFKGRLLKSSQEANYFLLMGVDNDRQKIKDIFSQLNSPSKVEEAFNNSRKSWLGYLDSLKFDFQDKDYNNWLLWVKFQPALRKLFGCSFLPHFDYGKGGRGWRDLWQDALTLIINEPHGARGLILNNFKGVRIDGSNATIITREGEFISDRNRLNRSWMDHGVWPYLTLRLYIHKTADIGILLEEAAYFKDHLFKRMRKVDWSFSPKDFYLRDKNNRTYKGSVLEHVLIQNLVQFFNVGRHNIIRLESADWNDGLDMAFEEGESVTFSFMYAHNLLDICVLLTKLRGKMRYVYLLKEAAILLDTLGERVDYSDYRAKQKRLDEYLESLEVISGKKIKIDIQDLALDLAAKAHHMNVWLKKKEWLKEGFFNGYYDNQARRVEGRIKGKVRMMLSPQVFAIMSGIADSSQIKKIWVSIKKYLQDKRLKGLRLNTDFGSLHLDLGRAFGFSYGDKENGAFFNHMTVMLAKALYSRGFIAEGFEVLDSIYRMSTGKRAMTGPMIPEYFNSQGRGLYHYLTGSASWYIYTLIEEVLGIKFSFGDIRLVPKLGYANFSGKDIKIDFSLGNKDIRFIFLRGPKGKNVYQIKWLTPNSRRLGPSASGYIIKKESLKNGLNTFKVYLG